jgi:very-short-patch-repair endonuclease
MDSLQLINYGTEKYPLYKAKDIGDLLEIKSIRKTLESIDDKFKFKKHIKTNGVRYSNTWLLSLDGIKRVIIISRKPKSIELCRLFNIECDVKIVAKETNFIEQIITTFNKFNMEQQYQCLNYRIDLYFIDYKLAIEFDENHAYKGTLDDIKRENIIKEYLKCKFIRVKYNDNIFKTINVILLEIISQNKSTHI